MNMFWQMLILVSFLVLLCTGASAMELMIYSTTLIMMCYLDMVEKNIKKHIDNSSEKK